MKFSSIVGTAVTTFTVSLACVLPVQAQSYTFTDLGTIGGNNSQAYGINNLGTVVGWSTTIGGASRATVWNGRNSTVLDTLGGSYSYAYSINNSGVAVGVSWGTGNAYASAAIWNGTTPTAFNMQQGFDINSSGVVAGFINGQASVWNGNTSTNLGTLGGSTSIAWGINDSGVVAGYASTTGNAAIHATVWNGNIATDLGTLGGSNSYAYRINNSGVVVGSSDITGNAATHATVWNSDIATDLGGPGYSQANGINNLGAVVGWASTATGTNATLWMGGTTTDLNTFLDASTVNAGWRLVRALDINDQGVMVGDAENSLTGQTHAFVLTPVPEPETYAMLLAGLGLIGAIGRRRRLT